MEYIEVWLPGMQRRIFEGICTWDAEVEVAVAPPARKTFFCTFGAMSRLKKVGFMFSFALNMICSLKYC